MINIKLIAVGKIKEQFLKDEIQEYYKRLTKYCKLNIIEVEDCKIKDNASNKEIENILTLEGKRILQKTKDNEFIILLDIHGEAISSIALSEKIDLAMNKYSTITFIIGGSLGLSDEVRQHANFRLKLSDLTFTHQMTRVIILEQIYRSFKILNNETYHK